VFHSPDEIWTNFSFGTWPTPKLKSPQQVAVPSERSPQAWASPAATWVKVPAGG